MICSGGLIRLWRCRSWKPGPSSFSIPTAPYLSNLHQITHVYLISSFDRRRVIASLLGAGALEAFAGLIPPRGQGDSSDKKNQLIVNQEAANPAPQASYIHLLLGLDPYLILFGGAAWYAAVQYYVLCSSTLAPRFR
jgi:hypothetical protein